jgi:hypothetical protein
MNSEIIDIERRLNIELPTIFLKYPVETQNLIIAYLESLTPIEKKAYLIAKDHLGSSFNILRSNGFIEWKNKK